MHFGMDNGICRLSLHTRIRTLPERSSEASWGNLPAASHRPAALCKSEILNTPHQRFLILNDTAYFNLFS